ncbi:MAG: PAP/fibrillin family protein [Polymorphobacter sp.]|uniref:PAP/fibrillin family protein n=1 Tax=Polymorphobacter sp. TaxID=1909290 RepID=UPI003A83E85D
MTKAAADLLIILSGIDPTRPLADDVKARIEAAIAATEASAPAPDFGATPAAADGVWTTLYSSQGIFGDVPVSFMTRAMPGGGADGGTARVRQVWQEIDMGRGFYRNSMLLEAGPAATPIHYLATADVAPAPERPNGFGVAFRQMVFAPGAPGVDNAQVRAALALSAETPLSITVPSPQPAPATVTYLDDDLRINRGKDYVAAMQRVR